LRYPEFHGRLKSKPVIDSVLSRVIIIPPSDCWIWMGTTGEPTNPYGTIIINGVMTQVHRWSYSHFNGDIPDALQVLHWCDIKLCICPYHLFLGTQTDNMRDMKVKGRYNIPSPKPGILNPVAKFNESQILAIRADDRSQRTIALDYGVRQPTISLIKRRETYQNIP